MEISAYKAVCFKGRVNIFPCNAAMSYTKEFLTA